MQFLTKVQNVANVFIHSVSFKVILLMQECPVDSFVAVKNIFLNPSWREQTAEEQEHRDHTLTAELNFFSAESCVCRWRERKKLWSHDKGKRGSECLFLKKWLSHS